MNIPYTRRQQDISNIIKNFAHNYKKKYKFIDTVLRIYLRP